MAKISFFRYLFYFRSGYQLYFAFIFAGLNTLVLTYYLALERVPVLKDIFPTFAIYAVVLVSIAIPILILVGYSHFKKIGAFKSGQEITQESNPYVYKLGPGHAKYVSMPHQLMVNKILLKLATNEKITSDEIKEMEELQKKMEYLIQGGYIGKPKENLPFNFDYDEKI